MYRYCNTIPFNTNHFFSLINPITWRYEFRTNIQIHRYRDWIITGKTLKSTTHDWEQRIQLFEVAVLAKNSIAFS